jgi:hypothetical protein
MNANDLAIQLDAASSDMEYGARAILRKAQEK